MSEFRKKPRSEGSQCEAVTKTGRRERCRHRQLVGSRFCSAHQPKTVKGNHSWRPGSPECEHCGMVERDGFFRSRGRVYMVYQWSTPSGVLVGIRPVAYREPPSGVTDTIEDTFPGVPVRGKPGCPKTREAWQSVTTPEDCW